MKNTMRTIIVLFSVALLLVSFTITGCSSKPNAEQLQQLEETKAAALSAEEAQSGCESEQADVEAELAAKKQELADVQEEKATVSERLKEFAN